MLILKFGLDAVLVACFVGIVFAQDGEDEDALAGTYLIEYACKIIDEAGVEQTTDFCPESCTLGPLLLRDDPGIELFFCDSWSKAAKKSPRETSKAKELMLNYCKIVDAKDKVKHKRVCSNGGCSVGPLHVTRNEELYGVFFCDQPYEGVTERKSSAESKVTRVNHRASLLVKMACQVTGGKEIIQRDCGDGYQCQVGPVTVLDQDQGSLQLMFCDEPGSSDQIGVLDVACEVIYEDGSKEIGEECPCGFLCLQGPFEIPAVVNGTVLKSKARYCQQASAQNGLGPGARDPKSGGKNKRGNRKKDKGRGLGRGRNNMGGASSDHQHGGHHKNKGHGRDGNRGSRGREQDGNGGKQGSRQQNGEQQGDGSQNQEQHGRDDDRGSRGREQDGNGGKQGSRQQDGEQQGDGSQNQEQHGRDDDRGSRDHEQDGNGGKQGSRQQDGEQQGDGSQNQEQHGRDDDRGSRDHEQDGNGGKQGSRQQDGEQQGDGSQNQEKRGRDGNSQGGGQGAEQPDGANASQGNGSANKGQGEHGASQKGAQEY